MKTPVNVAITGAAGQIGYALAFRVASGQMLGPDQPVNLHLLEITPALGALQGVVMELNDCAFPTLNKVVATDDAKVAFKDCHVALLVGARPRGPGMERKDLLLANAQIFSAQGKALDAVADRNVRVLVVGNPANTNSLIAQQNAPSLEPAQLHGDDPPRPQPRAVAARREDRRARRPTSGRSIIWGNHSATQYPGPAPRDGRRASPRCRWSTRPGTRTPSSRPCSSAARRSSRRAARRRPRRPRRPRSTTSATGRSARRTATGCRWACRRTAATASRRA